MTISPARTDIVVLGLGPAGRAVAAGCAARGLAVTAVDPHPDSPWRATYGAWRDELNATVPVAATVAAPQAWTTHRQVLDRAYCVVDTAALQQSLDLSDVTVVAGRASADGRMLADGTPLSAAVIIDARGAPARARTQQSAYGVVVARSRAEPVLDGAEALFMDWRTDHGGDCGDGASFLYAVPLDDDRVLLEETCLAAKPGMTLTVLARRLRTRLAVRGLRLDGSEPVERVRFALDTPLPAREWVGRTPTTVRFGAAAPLVHPASGYSVATALGYSADIVEIVHAGGSTGELQRLIWPVRARAVHALRLRGLRTMLGFAPEDLPAFFAAFFALPAEQQRRYLSGRAELAGTAIAMTAMLPHLPPRLRWQLVRRAVIA